MAAGTETIDRLLTLALDSGTPEHEARNAAMAACRVLKSHGFGAAGTEADDLRTEADRLRRRVRVLEKQVEALKDELVATKAKYWTAAPSNTNATSDGVTRTIQNKIANKCCMECGVPIALGERCRWTPGLGIFCFECRPIRGATESGFRKQTRSQHWP